MIVCRPHSPANRCALFVTGPDGMDARMVLSAADFSGLSTSLSPDGKTVLYDRWVDGEPGRLYIVDLASGVSHQVPFDNLAPEENSNIAELSPDGSQILFDRYHGVDGEHFAVVPSAGGEVRNIGRAWTGPRARCRRPTSRRMGSPSSRTTRLRPPAANCGSWTSLARDRSAARRRPQVPARLAADGTLIDLAP